jgi:hypothetical protein
MTYSKPPVTPPAPAKVPEPTVPVIIEAGPKAPAGTSRDARGSRPRWAGTTPIMQAVERREEGEGAEDTEAGLGVPSPERLFGQLDTEADLRERIRQDAKHTKKTVIFPDEPVVSKEPYVPRRFPAAAEHVEPNYTCYQRLLFEEKNSERYGWDLGIIQPFVSAGAFYFDFVTLPYHAFTRPCQKYECSAGYCLPGDPVPYLIYPPELSLTGTVAEGGAIAAVLAIFP